MTRIAQLLAWLLALGAALPAHANPVTYSQQLCVMLNSGISQEMAWSYITQEHTKAAMANPQTLIPLYSAAAAGWAFGTALGNTVQAHVRAGCREARCFKGARGWRSELPTAMVLTTESQR